MKHANFVLADAIMELDKYEQLCPQTLHKLQEIKEENELAKESHIFSLTKEELKFLENVLEMVDYKEMKKEEKEIRDGLLHKLKEIENDSEEEEADC